jgi:hypothetical protein
MPNQTLFLKLFTIGLSLFAGLCMPVAAQISPHQSVNAQYKSPFTDSFN